MSRKSSVATDPVIRAAVDAALQRACTIDEIVAHLRTLGSTVSRSAVGRYAQDYAELASSQRDLAAVAANFGKEFGADDGAQGRMARQLITGILTRVVLPHATGEATDVGDKQIANYAKALKDLASAGKIDADREFKIREEARKEAKIEAAEAAEGAARTAGASDETIQRIRAGILGIAA